MSTIHTYSRGDELGTYGERGGGMSVYGGSEIDRTAQLSLVLKAPSDRDSIKSGRSALVPASIPSMPPSPISTRPLSPISPIRPSSPIPHRPNSFKRGISKSSSLQIENPSRLINSKLVNQSDGHHSLGGSLHTSILTSLHKTTSTSIRNYTTLSGQPSMRSRVLHRRKGTLKSPLGNDTHYTHNIHYRRCSSMYGGNRIPIRPKNS